MPHPYPPRLQGFSYVGRYSYALEFTTDARQPTFTDKATVDLLLPQILRAATLHGFSVAAYCFMPDHVHLVIDASRDDSDCKGFIKAAKQFSGYYYRQSHDRRLWQRYSYERVMRDEMERALTIRYVLANPVKAGIARHPSEYPFLGSQRYSVEELLQISEYSDVVLLD
jgi:putative transposase